MYVHLTKNYRSILLTLFLAGMYVYYTKRYCSGVPTLVTCENILMDREERLRRID